MVPANVSCFQEDLAGHIHLFMFNNSKTKWQFAMFNVSVVGRHGLGDERFEDCITQ